MKVSWKTCFQIGITIFILFLAIHYWPAAVKLAGVLFLAARPLFLGCVMAYLVNILMSVYERHYFVRSKHPFVGKSRRIVCMLCAVLTLAGILCLLIKMVLPELISCIRLLGSEIPAVWERVLHVVSRNEVLASTIEKNLESSMTEINWNNILTRVLQILSIGVSGMLGSVITTASSVFSAAVNGIIGGIFAIYLLAGKERLTRQCRHMMEIYLPQGWTRSIYLVIGVLHQSFRRFIVGQCVEAVILGSLCTLGMLLLRFPYATMIGALVGFTALIPVAGAYIGAGVGAFMILAVSPVQAAGFLVYIVLLQQIEGNLIYPRVVGSSIGLPGIWVLAAVTVGGGIFGVGGMLIGVPLTAAVYQLLHMDIRRREAVKKCRSSKKT